MIDRGSTGATSRSVVMYCLAHAVPSFPEACGQARRAAGRRVVEGSVKAEHRELFSQILEYYQQLLDGVAEQVSACGYEPTTRVKTTGTLIDKLRREHGIKLSRIQDVAGARIIVGRLRAEQDQAVAKIIKVFEGLDREPLVIDRRLDPRFGYRAVHVIVYPESVPIEIQVRTTLQDLWAQIFENVAGQWGRQIHYGGPPDSPLDSVFTFTLEPSRHAERFDRIKVLRLLEQLSDHVADYESATTKVVTLEEKFVALTPDIEKIPRLFLADAIEKFGSTPEVVAAIKEAYVSLRAIAIKLCHSIEADKRRRGRIIRRRCPDRENPKVADIDAVVKWIVPLITKKLTDARLEATRQ